MANITAQGQQQVNTAVNQGQGAINAFDPSNYANTTMSGLNTIIGGQNQTQNNYQQAFKDQIANQPSATDYYNQGMNAFNVRPLQDTANTLNNAVLQDPINNVNASKGFNVDNAQIQQKTDQDLAYLTPQANAAQNNATTAQGNAMNFANMGMQQNTMNLLPVQEQGQYLMQQYAAQQTGWTTAQSQQLSALQAKMDAGVQLTSAEMSAYATLSSAEASYQGALAQANATTNAARINQQFQTVAPASTLVNTANGAFQKYH